MMFTISKQTEDHCIQKTTTRITTTKGDIHLSSSPTKNKTKKNKDYGMTVKTMMNFIFHPPARRNKEGRKVYYHHW